LYENHYKKIESLILKSGSVSSLISLFKYYVGSGQLIFAESMANDLINNNSKNIELLLTCLELQVVKGEYDQALKVLNLLAIAEYPSNSCELCLQLVNFRLKKLNTTEQALKCAEVLLASGKLNEVEQVFRHALELEPKNTSIKTQLAKFYLDVGELSLAISTVKEVLQVDELNDKAWSIYGSSLKLLGNDLESFTAHQKALTLDAENYESLLDVAAILINQAKDNQDIERSIVSSNKCLHVYLKYHQKLENIELSICKIKHDNEQAKYLISKGRNDSFRNFVEVSGEILERFHNSRSGPDLIVSSVELEVIRHYNKNIFIFDQNLDCSHFLNGDLNWDFIADQYKNSSPSLVVIDNFLSPQVLNYLRSFCYESKVWHKTYKHGYLGATADKGFLSKIHFGIAQELKSYLFGVIQQDRLEQLWAFKYESVLGKGINVHADFARINLNFWITPDEYHLNKDHGGIIVYTEPAPRDWNYFDYNINSEKIYDYLNMRKSSIVTVPYKSNRAVLFNSTLFHETDEIKFEDTYLGRRINMTYLFGSELK